MTHEAEAKTQETEAKTHEAEAETKTQDAEARFFGLEVLRASFDQASGFFNCWYTCTGKGSTHDIIDDTMAREATVPKPIGQGMETQLVHHAATHTDGVHKY